MASNEYTQRINEREMLKKHTELIVNVKWEQSRKHRVMKWIGMLLIKTGAKLYGFGSAEIEIEGKAK